MDAIFNDVVVDTIVGVVSKATVPVASDSILGAAKGKRFSMVTGIESISRFSQEIYFSDAATVAGQCALETSGVYASGLGILLVCTQSADFSVPAVGSKIHKSLGLSKSCNVIDINQGCNAVPNLLMVASSLMRAGGVSSAMILVGDLSSRHVAEAPGAQRALFGDSVCGMVLKRGPGELGCKIEFYSDGFESILLPQSNSAGRFASSSEPLRLDGEAVYNFAVPAAERIIRETLIENSLSLDDFAYLSLHQANKTINEAVKKRLDISGDRVLESLKSYGNTSSASVLLNLAQSRTSLQGRIMICGFGVGLSCGISWFKSDHSVKTLLIGI